METVPLEAHPRKLVSDRYTENQPQSRSQLRALLVELTEENPILAALQGQGLSLVEVVSCWNTLEKDVDRVYLESIERGDSEAETYAAVCAAREHLAERIHNAGKGR